MHKPTLEYRTPVPASRDVVGVTSFVCGIAALVPMLGFKSLFTVAAGSSIFPMLEISMTFLGMATGFLAVVLALVALYDARRSRSSTRWGLRGLIAGVVGCFAAPVVFNLVVYVRGLVLAD